MIALFARCLTRAIKKAMRPAAASQFCATWDALTAHGHSMWASRVETTATRGVNEARNLATSREIANTLVAISTEAARIGRGRDQQLRIGMHGPLDHLFTWSSFNHLTCVHD